MMRKAKIAALASALMLGAAGMAFAQSGGGGSGSGGASGGASGGGGGAAGSGLSSGAGMNSGSSADSGARTGSSAGTSGGAGVSGGASADVPAAGGSTSLTQPGVTQPGVNQPGVTRAIPGQTGTSTGAAAGTSSSATGMTEPQIRDRLRAQGFDDVTGLVRRGDVWEGRVTRDGRSETIRIDPLTGQAVTR